MSVLTTTETRDALIQDVDKLKRDAVQVAHDVRNHATAHVDETRQQVKNTIQSLQEKLTARPFALVGFGFAAGLLLGFKLRR